jgi:hypothetical protein
MPGSTKTESRQLVLEAYLATEQICHGLGIVLVLRKWRLDRADSLAQLPPLTFGHRRGQPHAVNGHVVVAQDDRMALAVGKWIQTKRTVDACPPITSCPQKDTDEISTHLEQSARRAKRNSTDTHVIVPQPCCKTKHRSFNSSFNWKRLSESRTTLVQNN